MGIVSTEQRESRLLACERASEALKLAGISGKFSSAVAVAKRFANGEATADEFAQAKKSIAVVGWEPPWGSRCYNTVRDAKHAARATLWDDLTEAEMVTKSLLDNVKYWTR